MARRVPEVKPTSPAAAIVLVIARVAACDTLYAEVWQDGARLERVQLTDNTDREIDIGGHNTVVLAGKTAAITWADCPDQVCVRTGRLTRAGQTAVCLPHRVVLKLVGETDGGVDAIES